MAKQLLLIDADGDEIDFYELAVKSGNLNCQCHHVSNFNDALVIIESVIVDVILIDFSLVNFPALTSLKELCDKANTPVFIISTFDCKHILNQLTGAGASGCLYKGSSLEEISELIKHVLY